MATFYLKKPSRETLPFRTELLSHPATMAYRIGQEGGEDSDSSTGCIQFGPEEYDYWLQIWTNAVPERYSAYLLHDGTPVGEVCYYTLPDIPVPVAGILIHARFRGQGLCATGLRLLIDRARTHGLARLCAIIPATARSALRGYSSAGFVLLDRNENDCLLEKTI